MHLRDSDAEGRRRGGAGGGIEFGRDDADA